MEVLKTLKINHTFKAKNKSDDGEIEYRIQDLPEEYFEDAIKMLKEDFATEETFCVSKNVTQKEAVMKELSYFWLMRMERNLSVGCFLNDKSNELVGVSVMSVINKGDRYDVKPTEKDAQDFLALVDWLHEQYDVFGKYNVDACLRSHALCVKKDFRNRGIAMELIKIREQILRNLNLKVTSTFFTVASSQKCAKNAGHVVVYEMSYDELQKKFPDFDFSKGNTEYFKIMDFAVQTLDDK